MDYKCMNCRDTFKPDALTRELVEKHPEIYGGAVLCWHCEREMMAAKAANMDLCDDLPPV